jgi:serine/threonine protein kinase
LTCTVDGVLFIAMRYVPGGDVRTLMRRAGPLPPTRAAAIISPMASALHSAHSAGLVHRDVKPANMLADVQPGRPDHVYLSDFGLSKGALSLGLTGSGHFLGTPGYSAPEQIQGRPVDGRADQYALACTAFEMLCGAALFPRDEVLAMMYAHLSEPPPPLTSRRLGTPAATDAVFARALAKEPADRYASCREFADALRTAFALPAYHSAPGSSPRWPAAPDQRETARGPWPVTQDQARHALSPARHTHPPAPLPPSTAADRKLSVTRRTMLGLAVATTAGLAVTGWELDRPTPRHTPTRSQTSPDPASSNGPPPYKPAATRLYPRRPSRLKPDGIVYVNTGTEQYALRADNGARLWNSKSLTFAATAQHNRIYAMGSDGLYLIEGADSRQLWHAKFQFGYGPENGQNEQRVIVDGDNIYTVAANGEVNAISPASGSSLELLHSSRTCGRCRAKRHRVCQWQGRRLRHSSNCRSHSRVASPAARQIYIVFKYVKRPSRRKFLGSFWRYHRSPTGSGKIYETRYHFKYSIFTNRIVAKSNDDPGAGPKQGNLKYFGQVSAREGMVRYFELKSPASHERMYWYLIDPFYDPFGKTPGLYISLNLAGLPTAGPMLLSRHRLPIKWVEEHLDSQILQINPFSGEESLSEQEIMN